MQFTRYSMLMVLALLLATPPGNIGTAHASDDLAFDLLNNGRGNGGGPPHRGGGGGDDTGSDDDTGGGSGSDLVLPTLQSWMDPEILEAWKGGYFGQGATITTIDDFSSSNRIRGDLGLGFSRLRHGEWTELQASMIAPEADMRRQDFGNTRRVSLSNDLNILNLSYGMMGAAGFDVSNINWSQRERSIIEYATDGSAVISKAAGNDNVAVGVANASGNFDYLNAALIGTSAIFVGALNINGTPSNQAVKASYSNYAGDDPLVQARFLMVGVEGHKTNLYGTSFAAPIISGYAAVLGSKFTTATPTQIGDRLLDTARQDTISGYNRRTHGMGQASILNAIAPNGMQ